jgi:cell division protein ZapD
MAEQGKLSVVDQHRDPAASDVIYEQPLNERIRGFLRLEYLFQIVAGKAAGESPWDSHAAIASLIDIAELLQRADVKSDLVKELERQCVSLNNLASNPQVDTQALDVFYKRLQGLATKLKDLRQLGQAVRNDELISAVRQRIVIAGGTCSFDLPGYHYWLHRPYVERRKRLDLWRTELSPVEQSIAVILGAIRESAYPMQATAKAGTFQKSLEPVGNYQLIRIILPPTTTVFPEISAGRHRFNLRFMELAASGGRPAPVTDNIEFELRCCML